MSLLQIASTLLQRVARGSVGSIIRHHAEILGFASYIAVLASQDRALPSQLIIPNDKHGFQTS